jgi:hypothetical protein
MSDRLLEQRPVEIVDRLLTATTGELHERGGMGNRPVQRDPAEPLEFDRQQP